MLDGTGEPIELDASGSSGDARHRVRPPRTEDPAGSGLMLHDGVLPAGFLCVRDTVSDELIVRLPSHVILSCCSSAGIRRFNGGESIGLTASCLRGGARCVIATAVDIFNWPFTERLDDMLITEVRAVHDHFSALRNVQLRLLDRWREYEDVECPQDGPHPIVWA